MDEVGPAVMHDEGWISTIPAAMPVSLANAKFMRELHVDPVRVVSLVTHRHTMEFYACKETRSVAEKRRVRAATEFRMHVVLRDVHGVLRCVGFEQTESASYLFTEYCALGTLYENVRRQRPALHDSILYINEVAKTVAAMHARGYAHRNITATSVLCKMGRHRDLPCEVLLGSLGACCSLDRPRHKRDVNLYYSSPEVHTNKPTPYDAAKLDAWMLGVLFFFLVVGELPFMGEVHVETVRQIVREPPRIPKDTPHAIASIMTALLHKDPQRRMSVDELLELPAFIAHVPPALQANPRRVSGSRSASSARAKEAIARFIRPRAVSTSDLDAT